MDQPSPQAEERIIRAPKSGVIDLTREEAMALHLVLTKRKLAESEHTVATYQIKEAQMKMVQAVKEEAVVMDRLSNRYDLGKIKALKVIGSCKVAYELEE